ncbi:probable aspartic proteinase GIP2 [Brassica napus]|nr:probable aspartic proteinase GIP2 [Brassica napus]
MGATSSYDTPVFGGKNPVPMTLTPLKIDSGKYLISPTSIYVDGIPLSLNPSLLEGGAQLSTVVPYTVLQTDVYNALAQSFTLKATKIGMTETTGHAPFKHCFEDSASGKNIDGSVMEIGLPGNGKEVKWRFQGENMVERVSETVICLAFVDGGKKPNESMVIGTHQLQEYLIEFDFSTMRVAFSDPLVLHNTRCYMQ